MNDLIFEENCFEKIKNCSKPILLFGMGNGADMIIDVFKDYSIDFDGVFASDRFVRGHSFHGREVMTLEKAEEKFGDFAAVMTFAVHDDETIDFVKKISKNHLFFSPTVPVAGKGLFTREYAQKNIEKIKKVYSLLCDEKSKKAFENVIKFKISGKVEYLFEVYSDTDEVFENVFNLTQDENILDLGAYDGDTLKLFYQKTGGNFRKITALEPDEKNFRKLTKTVQSLGENNLNINLVNKGIWDENTMLSFEKSAGRQSKFSEKGKQLTQVVTVDSFNEDFSFIKMDVEGSEKRALLGAEKTIKKHEPSLYVCAYHRNEDIFELPLLVHSYVEDYKFYFRQHKYIPAWESNFYITK